jgi:precorrin-4/cobalt-precorrin-4 C11-methyltransferase
MIQPKVYFIGAGPGDPELITVKGQRLVSQADVIIYAGSLVNPAIIDCRKPEAIVYNSATMDLPEIIDVMQQTIAQGQSLARVHTGDPSIYGSIREQIEDLDRLSIPWEVIPGVSSFVGAASVLGREFTVPEISQTVICTRMEGRTPVPELESIESLATHQASMAIFLSVQMIDELCTRLLTSYPADTPVAVVEKATWPDQRHITGTLTDISEKVKQAGIRKTAMILVGRFLGDTYNNSKLYDAHFTHEYRKGKKP